MKRAKRRQCHGNGLNLAHTRSFIESCALIAAAGREAAAAIFRLAATLREVGDTLRRRRQGAA